MPKKLTQEEFEKRILEIHGGKYKIISKYINKRNKITAYCQEHKIQFDIIAENLMKGNRCPECAKESFHSKKSLEKNIVEQFKKVHGNKYNYSNINYINIDTPITIYCNTCDNNFQQIPYEHRRGAECPYCSGRIKTTENVIKEAKKVHGNKYDYSKLRYINSTTKMEIICPKHKSFFQTYENHILLGQNCPICRDKFKGEIKISNYLNLNNIEHVQHYSFKDCKDKRALFFDFYIPKFNMCIEYDGKGHYKTLWKGYDLEGCQRRDKIKNEYCLKNNIKLLRIPYWDFNKIEDILNKRVINALTQKAG